MINPTVDDQIAVLAAQICEHVEHDGDVRIFDFGSGRHVLVSAEQALDLCLAGHASIGLPSPHDDRLEVTDLSPPRPKTNPNRPTVEAVTKKVEATGYRPGTCSIILRRRSRAPSDPPAILRIDREGTFTGTALREARYGIGKSQVAMAVFFGCSREAYRLREVRGSRQKLTPEIRHALERAGIRIEREAEGEDS